MQVILSGYNVDKEILEEFYRGNSSEEVVRAATPEVLSAAYARISRDPQPVNELREAARKEVEGARKSNRNIVFGMGHHSVAEHAVLNYDLIGISRLAVEALEQHRLCSYTEKSQRYITLKGDFVLPTEFNDEDQKKFVKLVQDQNGFYFSVLEPLQALQEKKHPEMLEKEKKTLEGWAKEDARYSLSLATEAQLGFTANARNLEYVLRDFRVHPLAEVRALGEALYAKAKKVVPSLIILADEKEFQKTQKATLEDSFFKYGKTDAYVATTELLTKLGYKKEKLFEGRILVSHNDPDQQIISSLLARHGNLSLDRARRICLQLSEKQKKQYLLSCLENLTQFDALPREWEMGELVFDLVMSSSAYAQMKRHRMCTQLMGEYNPELGITVPESITEIGHEKELNEVAEKSNELFHKLRAKYPHQRQAADYCLTNAHRRRVQVKMNLRELYHFSRLREDSHAQWDIRSLAQLMAEEARKVAPLTTLLLGGKDGFQEMREKLYGNPT